MDLDKNFIRNFTFFYQLAIFLGLIFVLNALLFQPILKVIEARRKGTRGEWDEVEKLKKQAEEKSKLYEKKIEEAKKEAFALRDDLKKEGEVEAAKILNEARLEAEQALKSLDQQIKEEETKGKEWLNSNVSALSKKLAEQVLGRNV